MAAKAYVTDDYELFFFAAGTAVEHLTKSLLAARHPSLIVEKSDFDTLLSFLGLPGAKKDPTLRTISGRDAVTRCSQLIPAAQPMVGKIHKLIDVRNGVVHLGVLGPHEADDALANLARFVEQVLGAMDKTARDFWGYHTRAVAQQVSEAATRVEKRVAAKRAVAKELYRQRYGAGADSPVLQALRQMVQTQRLVDHEEHLVECPACGEQAVAAGSYTIEEEPDVDTEAGYSWVSDVSVVALFFPSELRCAFCDLHLTGDEELGAAGCEGWELDPNDFGAGDWEPDEDLYRDR
jgi:hypothetical protein